MYIKDDRGHSIRLYERPSFSRLRKETEFSYKDIETGMDIYKDIYNLSVYFPSGIVVIKSLKEEKIVEIERALSGPLAGEHHVEIAYCISLGEDLAENIQHE
jgi:hypothetical protein